MLRLTHLTFAVKKFDESIAFYGKWFGLVVHRDRRPKGKTVWLTTPEQNKKESPDFVFVLEEAADGGRDAISRIHHIGFQAATRKELDDFSDEAKKSGVWVEGPVDAGGVVGSYVFIRDPNGHIWECTWGQPLGGL